MSDAVESAARHTQQRAERAAAALYERDRASQALGMRLLGVRPGWAQVVMRVRPDMVNGHGLCHGGIVFALGDSAAEASELWRTRRNGIYEISVRNQRGERIALFRGRSYRIDGQVVSEE